METIINSVLPYSSMPTFNEKVWNIITRIPKGKVSTYRDVAHALNTRAYRAVGTALSKNPNAPQVPCHRVVNSSGIVGKYSGGDGTSTKIALLKAEGIEFENGKVKNLSKVLYTF